jgi:hypothetical protein
MNGERNELEVLHHLMKEVMNLKKKQKKNKMMMMRDMRMGKMRRMMMMILLELLPLGVKMKKILQRKAPQQMQTLT